MGAGEAVKEVGGSVETLGPEEGRERGLEEGANDIVRRADHPLSLAVLRGSIRIRHAQVNAAGEAEGTDGMIIELTAIVTLDGIDGEAELSGDPGKVVNKGGERVRLRMQQKSPRIMREIINNHLIVLVAKNVE